MNKSILITGCSTGIGLSSAQILQKRGYRVFASARKTADVEKLKGLGLESLQLDVADSTSIHQAFHQVLEKTGGTLDALFNNAGFAIPGAVEDLTRDMMREQFETNVFGAMELTNLAIPVMRQQGHGRIIQNTSLLGIVTMPFRGNYNASKFALEGFSSTLRQELRKTAIHVSIIAPGPIKTQFRENAYQHSQALLTKDTLHKANYLQMEKMITSPSASEAFFNLPPDAVVKKLIHALESKSPKAHYYIGFPAHLLIHLHSVLPDKAFDWVIAQTV